MEWKPYCGSMQQKKAGKWYRGILEESEPFMFRWHVEEEHKRSKRRAARVRKAQSRKGGWGTRKTAGAESKETANRVARHQAE